MKSETFTLLLKNNLSQASLRKAGSLKLLLDLKNIYSLLAERPFDRRGSISKTALKSFLAAEENLPSYVFEFFDSYQTRNEQITNFPQLLSRYFQTEIKAKTRIVAEFLRFEYDMSILSSAYLARFRGIPIEHALKNEDMDNPTVLMLIAQKDGTRPLVFPSEFSDLEKRLTEVESLPFEMMQAFEERRFEYYRGQMNRLPFTLRAILAYMMQLWTVEEFFALQDCDTAAWMEKIVEDVS